MRRLLVRGFGDPPLVALVNEPEPPLRSGRVRVRVTHASIGSTDALAARGGYLLQPRVGFTTGYDFVGVVEATTQRAAAQGLVAGVRVCGVLPRMGTHATVIDASPSWLVPVPDALDSAEAAALPLDLVTVALARSYAGPIQGTLLVQGATGPVGRLAVQGARADGLTVIGTSSRSNSAAVEALGATWVDYAGADPAATVRELIREGVQAAIDHTGASWLRRAAAPTGTVVRIAFTGRRGHERMDTFVRGFGANVRRFGRPRERVASVPLLVATRAARARSMLVDGLERVARGELQGLPVKAVRFDDAPATIARLAAGSATGHKLVLVLDHP
jgi:NADPH:quinone reductase-like Zn-dependent oxidoreductase